MRIGELLRGHGLGPDVVVGPLRAGCILPASSGDAWPCWPRPDLTGRRRPPAHPGPAAPTPRRSSTTSSRATTSCTTSTASPATAGWSSGHRRRGARLPPARVPGRRQALRPVRPDRAVRHYTGGERRRCRSSVAPTGRRRRPGALRGAADRPGARRALPEPAAHRATPFPEDTPWQRELEDAFPYQETPDQLKAIVDVKATWRRRSRWTASCAATSASARPRSRSGPPSRRCRTASRWRCSCPRRCSRSSTSDLRRPLRRLPGQGRGAVPLPHARPGQDGWPRACARARSTSSSAPTGCSARTSSSRTSACWSSTRSSASG